MFKLIMLVLFIWTICIDVKAHRAGWALADFIGGVFTGGLFTVVRFIWLMASGN